MTTGLALAQSALLLVAAGLALVVAGVAWARQPLRGMHALALLAFGVGVWCSGYALEIGAADPGMKLAWARLQYFGILVVPPGWLLFGLRHRPRPTRARLAALVALQAVMPLVTLVLAFTSSRHTLLWTGVAASPGGLGPLRFSHGPWFWVLQAQSHVQVLVGTLLMLRDARQTPVARRRLLCGALVPWGANLLYVTSADALGGLDPTPFAFSLAALVLWAGIAEHHLLDLRPIARSSVFEAMSDAAIVVDGSRRVADLNPAAELLVGDPAGELLGRQIDELPGLLWSRVREALGTPPDGVRRPTVPIRLGDLERAVQLDVRVTPVGPGEGQGGHVIVARDNTRLQRALQAQLEARAFSEGIVSSAPIGIVVLDRELRVQAWNPFMQGLTGLAPERCLGQPVTAVLPSLREAGLEPLLGRALAGETVSSGAVPFALDETGRGGWAVCTFNPTRDAPGGLVTGLLVLFEDVSRTRHVEREVLQLQEQLERRAEALAGILPVGIFRTSPSGWCTYVNQRWCEIMGCQASDGLGLGWQRFLHADERANVLEQWSDALQGRRGGQREYRVVRPDGAVRWVSTVAAPELDPRGEPLGFLGVISDVTEARSLTESLRDSEHTLRTVTDSVPGMVFRVRLEPDGTPRFTFVSRGAQALSGRAPGEEQLGLELATTRILADDFARLRETLDDAAALRSAFQTEVRLALPEGLRWIRCRADPGREPDGALAFTGMAWDVTEEKQAEERILLLSSAVEATADLVLIADADWRFEYVNAAFEQATGHRLLEIRGQRVGDVIDAGQAPGVLAELAAAMATGESFTRVFRNRRKDGSTYWEEKTITPVLDERGAVRHYVSTGRDITERRELERDLRRSETMAAMGRLVAGVAHEVRNPLFAISSLLDSFELELGDHEGFQAYGLRLRRQVDRVTDLMRELLEYGRPSPAQLARGPLGAVIEEAREARAAAATLAGVRVLLELEPNLPEVERDPARLRQVFENLLQNAIDHASPSGVVRLEATRRAGSVACRVRDDGPGFSPEDLAHAFEPFYTRRRGGTGLGLAIVQRIVEEHGGRIEARNHPGGGAVVEVSLPAVEVP